MIHELVHAPFTFGPLRRSVLGFDASELSAAGTMDFEPGGVVVWDPELMKAARVNRRTGFDAAGNIIHTRRMVALDEIAAAQRHEAERARSALLQRLVEDIRKTIEGPSSAKAKLAWIKELLAVQGYCVRE